MAIETLREFFVDQLIRAADGEKRLFGASSALVNRAADPELKCTLQSFKDVARRHYIVLEEARQELGGHNEDHGCWALSALLDEADERLQEEQDAPLRDAVMITEIQRLLHYQIAVYGALRSYAGLVGYPQLRYNLQDALDQKKAINRKLSTLATRKINRNAAALAVAEQAVG